MLALCEDDVVHAAVEVNTVARSQGKVNIDGDVGVSPHARDDGLTRVPRTKMDFTPMRLAAEAAGTQPTS